MEAGAPYGDEKEADHDATGYPGDDEPGDVYKRQLYGSPYLALVASRIPQYLVNATVCTVLSYVIYKSAVTRVATGSFQAS